MPGQRFGLSRVPGRSVAAGLVLAAAAVVHAQDAPKPVDVTGKWAMTLHLEVGTATPALVLKQTGPKVTGTYAGRYGTYELEGHVKDRTIQFAFTMGQEDQRVTMTFTGEVAADGETMKGTALMGELGEAAWTAKRERGSDGPRP